jgi:Uma2 family endonuclease
VVLFRTTLPHRCPTSRFLNLGTTITWSETGAADILLIVEVANTSLEYDLTVKRDLYAITGIVEYWVADLTNNRLLVHTDPAGDHYQTIRELHPGELIAPSQLPSCTIPVDLLLP